MKNETKRQLRTVAMKLEAIVINHIKKINENDIDDETAYALSKVRTARLWLRRFL